MPRLSHALTFAAVGAAVVLASPGPATASRATTSWGKVVTIADQRFGDLQSVTTDNGLVVAAWNGPSFNSLRVAVHRVGEPWSAPTTVADSAAAFSLQRDGKQAWLVTQDFSTVSVVEIDRDGTIGTPEVVGPSSDPFIADPQIGIGAHGDLAVAWHQQGDSALLAYHSAGGSWSSPETVPQAGGTVGVVVGAKGVTQVGVAQGTTLLDMRRAVDGTWHQAIVSSIASLPSMTGNPHGDVVFGWEIKNGDGTFSLAARYFSAETGFGATEHLADGVPYAASVSLAMAGTGAVVSAYRTNGSGSQEIAMTPADVDGQWAPTQTLDIEGGRYAVTMNENGDGLVTSFQLSTGLQLVQCPAGGSCGSAETNPATGDRFPSASIDGNELITLVWGRGCKTEECLPTRVVAQRSK